MKTRFIFFLICVSAINYLFSQDIIVLKTKDTLTVKVLQVNDNIVYKKYSNPDGPSYTVEKEKVNYIIYQNGEKDTFNVEQKKRVKKKRPSFIELYLAESLPFKPFREYGEKPNGYQLSLNGAWFFSHNVGLGLDLGIGLYGTQYTLTNEFIGMYLNIPISKLFSITSRFMGGLYTADIGKFSSTNPYTYEVVTFSSKKQEAFGMCVGLGFKGIVKHFGFSANFNYYYSKVGVLTTLESSNYQPVEFTDDYVFQPFTIGLGFSYVF